MVGIVLFCKLSKYSLNVISLLSSKIYFISCWLLSWQVEAEEVCLDSDDEDEGEGEQKNTEPDKLSSHRNFTLSLIRLKGYTCIYTGVCNNEIEI